MVLHLVLMEWVGASSTRIQAMELVDFHKDTVLMLIKASSHFFIIVSNSLLGSYSIKYVDEMWDLFA